MKKTKMRKRIRLSVEKVRVLTKELEQPSGGCDVAKHAQTEGIKPSIRLCTALTQ